MAAKIARPGIFVGPPNRLVCKKFRPRVFCGNLLLGPKIILDQNLHGQKYFRNGSYILSYSLSPTPVILGDQLISIPILK